MPPLRLAQAITAIEAPKAKERQGKRTDLEPPPNLGEGSADKGESQKDRPELDEPETGDNLAPVSVEDRKTRAKAAKAVGLSHGSLAKVTETRKVAEDESKPEPVRQVAREALDEMHETRKSPGAGPGPAQGVTVLRCHGYVRTSL